jgi:WXXGXW repeat (2 copies)
VTVNAPIQRIYGTIFVLHGHKYVIMKKILSVLLFCALCLTVLDSKAQISVGVSIRIAPPELPVYVQPACPYDGYLWTPGYWAYGDDGYFWVPGVWIRPPQVGYLWTPGYWGFEGGYYGWHGGYWGNHVGFYGGVNYGYGYGGVGFGGGMWRGGSFRYNTAVVNVNRTVIHNTYIDRTVINNRTVVNNRTSFNGPGGVTARPNAQEQVAMRESHIQRTSEQTTHEQTAGRDRNQFASVNHGRPANTAVARVNTNHTMSPNHANMGNTGNHSNQPHVQPAHVQQQHMQQQQQQPHFQQQQQHMQQQHVQQHVQQQHVQQQHMQPQPHAQPHANPEGGRGGGEPHGRG